MATKMKKNEKNGANRCPNCGATDIKLDSKTGKLKCNYCRSVFEHKAANARGGVEDLKGDSIGSGAADIIPDEKIIVTLKCPACGAEVVINTEEAVSARCHWCRHTLSLNEKMPNGAVPDLVLPFKTEKDVAEENIRAFVKKRHFFAHPTFRREFSPENVMGVYLPYMIVDVNAHAKMEGEAEHLIRKYTSGSGNHKTTYYDAEAFKVSREFDLLVDDLTIESSSERLQQDVRVNTNNVINAIMPFDTENCEEWNPNYLHGFASEKRDTNVGDLREQLKLQVGDIARYKVKETMTYYNRGARWESEEVSAKGTKWKAAYLPVWLYSYLQDDGKVKMLHYVAVNARTGETMGSVPINKTRLMFVSAILEILGVITGWFWIRFWIGIDTDDDNPFWFGFAGLTPGFIFYWVKMAKYRNMNARHKHEADTPAEIKNVKKSDTSIGRRNRLRSAKIAGVNDSIVKGVVAKAGEKMMGEKMANFLGIGRMDKTTPGDTVIGQQAAMETKKKAGKKVAIITIIVIATMISIIAFTVVRVALDKSRTSSRRRSGVDTNLSVKSSSSFKDFSDQVRGWSKENSAIASSFVNEMAFYNTNAENNLRAYRLSISDYKAGLSVSTSLMLDKELSRSGLVTDAGKELSDIIELNGFDEKIADVYNDGEENFNLRLYAERDEETGDYIFCDLRETQKSSSKQLTKNLFRVSLNCVEMDEDAIEANDIKID